MEIKSLIGGMVYGSLGAMLGVFEEITLPETNLKKEDIKPTDGIGTIRVPSPSLDAMETTFKAAGLHPEFHALASNPFGEHLAFQVRGNLISTDGQTQTKCKGYKVELKGWFEPAKIGVIKQGEPTKTEYKMQTDYYKVVIDGQDIVEIDVYNHIWRVNGQDVLADYRANMGI